MITKHVVMYSGGAGSAWVAKYVADKYGAENTVLLHTDTKWEDEDNYRFMQEVAEYVGVPITYHNDGRTPADIFRKDLYFGNFGTAPCSKQLKMKQTFEYVQESLLEGVKPILYFGIDFGEVRRAPRIAYNYKHNVDVFEDGIETRFPLVGEVDGTAVNGQQLLYGTDYLNEGNMPRMRNEMVFDCLEKQNFVKCEAKPKREIAEEWGVALPRMYALGFQHANCFTGDTRFITNEGVKTFAETVGQKVKVLGVRADWKDAEIKHFGKQKIVELTIKKGPHVKVVRTTAEHRWFKRKGRKEYIDALTSELKPGDYLKSMHSKTNPLIRPSAFGIAHGIAFGDGSVTDKWNPPARLVLCGDKAQAFSKYFPNSPKKDVPAGVEVADLPRFFKEFPSLTECKSYLYGWLTGYFGADGSVNNSTFTLSSAKRENLEFVREAAAIVGISTNPITYYMRTGFGEEETPLYSVSFIASTLREDFFINPKHAEKYAEWVEGAKATPPCWHVVSVRETDEVEDVYCAVVPKGHAFTLEDNLFTGNCGGICIKAGKKHYALLHEVWPHRYDEMEQLEKEINEAQLAKNGRRYTILSRTIETGEISDGKPKKKKVPYSLEEYRKEELEKGTCDTDGEDDTPCECVF